MLFRSVVAFIAVVTGLLVLTDAVHISPAVSIPLALFSLLVLSQTLPSRRSWNLMLQTYLALATLGLGMFIVGGLLTFIPAWLLIAFTIVSAAVVIGLPLWRGDRQRKLWQVAGRCEVCGYNLRSSFERCPECGSDIPEELARRRRLAAYLARKREETVTTPVEAPVDQQEAPTGC
jgi:hypothetical protein